MARNVEVGITIKAKDEAGATLRNTGETIKTTFKDTATSAVQLARTAEGGFGLIGRSVIVAHHAVRLAEMGIRAFNAAIGENITIALKFRDINDGATRQIELLGKNLELVRARVGDALIPILQGVADVMTPVLKSFQAWLVANRQLIGSAVIDWLKSFGSTLINGIANGTIMVTRAWNGWREIIAGVDAAVSKFYEMALGGISSVSGGLAKLAASAGLTSLADKLSGASQSAKDLGETFGQSSDEAVAKIKSIADAQAKLEASVTNVGAKAQVIWGQAMVAAQTRLANSVSGTNNTLDQQKAAMERLAQATAFAVQADKGLEEIAEANLQRRVDIANKNAQQMQQTMTQFASVAGQVGDAWGQAFEAVAAGSESASKASAKAAVQTARTIVLSAAAAAMAKQMEASSWMGVAGIAVGAAAASVVFAIIQGYMSKIPKAATGGMVVGGSPGRDSVPVMTMPGEVILDVSLVKGLHQLVSTMNAQKSSVSPTGGGQKVNINYQVTSQLPPDSIQQKQMVRSLARTLEDMARTGQLRLAPSGG